MKQDPTLESETPQTPVATNPQPELTMSEFKQTYKPTKRSTIEDVYPTPHEASIPLNFEAETESSYRTCAPSPEVIDFSVSQNLKDEETESTGAPMIYPCTNFENYHLWLKKYFPHLISKDESNLVENILKIKDMGVIFKFYYYDASKWRDYLGNLLYCRYYKFLIELVLI